LPSSTVYAFERFELDAATRRLTRDGELVSIPDRHVGVLLELVAHAGTILSKDALIEAVWRDVAVTDNSLEQAISALRRVLGEGRDGTACIQTVARQGYRFTAPVTRVAARASDATLDALLAPHRAWIEGRAALETLERDQIVRARSVFEGVLANAPDQASAHVGLANACILQFEMTRTDAQPDVGSLATAARHAREACRLGPDYGEAWATLGFVLDRTGQRVDALAASRRATTLEPDNWRHHFRLAYVSWGEERLRESHRTLALMPGFPLAHWLAATVHVARQAMSEAERELDAGIASQGTTGGSGTRFSSVALHWLRGLVQLSREDYDAASRSFECELASEGTGHLYARECCANTWYAIGALRHRQGRADEARQAFQQALQRVSQHRLAFIGLSAVDRGSFDVETEALAPSVDAAFVTAAVLGHAGRHGDAARTVDQALAAAPPGNAGWLLSLEPLLHVTTHSDVWAPVLARLRSRAA
jgi:DNA-binding winged helix-turn-helix (wHTH) protein